MAQPCRNYFHYTWNAKWSINLPSRETSLKPIIKPKIDISCFEAEEMKKLTRFFNLKLASINRIMIHMACKNFGEGGYSKQQDCLRNIHMKHSIIRIQYFIRTLLFSPSLDRLHSNASA